ncbi:MAG: hypothetical protein HOI53_01045 [Francisellaceae bacterium]|jgi:hypothetical protein|nr:hypothetical protein [Francisellaceae bacterium]MBT6206587.1 hypothetical protein [Francisellaceae bacterium]
MKSKTVSNIFFLVSSFYINTSIASTENASFVHVDSDYSYKMLDPTTNITKKQLFLLNHKDDYLAPNSLYLGASSTIIADMQSSSIDSKFSWLMRHPTSNNQVGKKASEAVIHSAQVHFSGALTPWLTSYTEILYDPEQSFGAGNITGLARNQLQLRKGYVLLGNKDCSHFYASVGKQDVPFGLMDTVSPFTASTVWHAFGALAYSAILGVNYNGLNASFTPIQGGAQFRAANTPVNGTNVPSRVNNYAADVNYTGKLPNSNKEYVLGVSFIKGSAYNQDFPVTHFSPGKTHNSAFDVYGKLDIDNFTIIAEFARTKRVWPGTQNPNPPLNVFTASKVEALNAGVSYTFQNMVDNNPLTLSAEFSRFKAGPSGAPWERQSQLTFGVAYKPQENVKFFAEVLSLTGYAPLNFISGQTATSTTTHSDRHVKTKVAVIGVQASI